MAKHTTICAGIDTGKRKLDVALDGSSEQLQIDNAPEGYKVVVGLAATPSGQTHRD